MRRGMWMRLVVVVAALVLLAVLAACEDSPATLHLRNGTTVECDDASSRSFGKVYSCETGTGGRRSYPIDGVEYVEWGN